MGDNRERTACQTGTNPTAPTRNDQVNSAEVCQKMLLNPILTGISQDQAAAITTFLLDHPNVLAAAKAKGDAIASGDVALVTAPPEGDEEEGKKVEH